MGKPVRCNAMRPCINGEVWQYDFGQELLIEGLSWITVPVSVQFATSETDAQTVGVDGTRTPDGILARIPDELLVNNDTTTNYRLYVYVYAKGEKGAATVASFILPVCARSRPDNYPST